MLKKLKLCVFSALCCVGSLVADEGLLGGQWSLSADYLYLMPSMDDTYFVIDSPESATFPSGKRVNNDFDFHSGYRVGAAVAPCGCNGEFSVDYSRLSFTQSKTIRGFFLWATVGRADFASNFENYVGNASSELKFLYQRMNALYEHTLYDNCGVNFGVLFGLEAAELKLDEKNVFFNSTSTGWVHQHSRASGIGPELGFSVEYDLFKNSDCCPGTLSLNVISTGSLLAANSRAHIKNILTADRIEDDHLILLDISNDKTWRVVPAFHARVGLNYDFCFSCVDASLEVGYEFSSYVRGLTRISFPDDVADSLSYNNYYNFDVQGLYVSANFKF